MILVSTEGFYHIKKQRDKWVRYKKSRNSCQHFSVYMFVL